MRRLFIFVLCVLFIIPLSALSSCNFSIKFEKPSDDEKLSSSFNQYCPHNSRLHRCNLPSGAIAEVSIEQDADDYYTIMNLSPVLEEVNYIVYKKSSLSKWAALPLDEIKADMKYIADKFAEFALEKELNAPYSLYVVCNYPFFVYDYDTDTLYYSNKLDAFVEMYNLYGTMNIIFQPDEDVRQFAEDNDIADAAIFGADISNGEFYTYGLENALQYQLHGLQLPCSITG